MLTKTLLTIVRKTSIKFSQKQSRYLQKDVLNKTLKGIHDVRLHKRKFLCAPSLSTKYLEQGFPKWAMTDIQGATSSKGARGEGAWAVKGHKGAMML